MLTQIKMKNGASFNFKSQTCPDTTSEEYENQIDPVRSKLPEATADTQSYPTSNGVDQMVYELYGLSDDEIKIVENLNMEV